MGYRVQTGRIGAKNSREGFEHYREGEFKRKRFRQMGIGIESKICAGSGDP